MDNLSLTPDSYDEYCVSIPSDSRLPNAGQRQCGYYDVKPALFGVGQNRVVNTKEIAGAKPQRYWDGITLSMNGRLPKGITVGGGLDMGQQVRDNCYTVDVPNIPRDLTGASNPSGPFCRNVTSFTDNMDIRIRASVPLKYGINASAIFRNTAGAVQNATWNVNNANITAGQVQFLNGRQTFAGNQPQALALHAQSEYYGDRFNQLDISVNKNVNTGIGRLRLAWDVYNALNANSTQGVTTVFTNSSQNRWLRPALFMDPRLMRLTASLSF